MLRSIGELIGYIIKGTDGDIGHVYYFHLDDVTWAIRYLVAEIGTWLAHPLASGSRRRALLGYVSLSPRSGGGLRTRSPAARRRRAGCSGAAVLTAKPFVLGRSPSPPYPYHEDRYGRRPGGQRPTHGWALAFQAA